MTQRAVNAAAVAYVEALYRVAEADNAGLSATQLDASDALHALIVATGRECFLCDPGTCPYDHDAGGRPRELTAQATGGRRRPSRNA